MFISICFMWVWNLVSYSRVGLSSWFCAVCDSFVPNMFSFSLDKAENLVEKAPPACSLVCWTYFFDPEDGGDKFLQNVGWNSTDYTASYPRRWYSSTQYMPFSQSEKLLSTITYKYKICFFNNRPIPINRHAIYLRQTIQTGKYRIPSTDWQPYNFDTYLLLV
jgi:hypothetical protein